MTKPLFPAAQAVLDAFYESITYADEISPSNVAAALRALDELRNARRPNPHKLSDD